MTFNGDDHLYAAGLGIALDGDNRDERAVRIQHLEAMCEDYGKRWSQERRQNEQLRKLFRYAAAYSAAVALAAVVLAWVIWLGRQ